MSQNFIELQRSAYYSLQNQSFAILAKTPGKQKTNFPHCTLFSIILSMIVDQFYCLLLVLHL